MTADQNAASRRWATVCFAAPLGVLAAAIAVGYLGFRTFVTAPALDSLALPILAIAAGVASFFSPCAFPLLPGYLSFYYTTGSEGESRPRALGLGSAAAAGVATFSLLLGLVIAALGVGLAQALAVSGPAPNAFVRVFRGLVGLALLVLGVAQIAGWSFKPRAADALAHLTRPRRGTSTRPAAALYLYGLGYSAAGMGCTGPILAGLMLSALAAGGFGSALSAFAIFTLTMASLMLMISVLVGASKQALVVRLKAATPKIKRAAGAVLIAVGAFHLYAAADIGAFVRLLFP